MKRAPKLTSEQADKVREEGREVPCRGVYGTRCMRTAEPGLEHCESCLDYIGALGTEGT